MGWFSPKQLDAIFPYQDLTRVNVPSNVGYIQRVVEIVLYAYVLMEPMVMDYCEYYERHIITNMELLDADDHAENALKTSSIGYCSQFRDLTGEYTFANGGGIQKTCSVMDPTLVTGNLEENGLFIKTRFTEYLQNETTMKSNSTVLYGDVFTDCGCEDDIIGDEIFVLQPDRFRLRMSFMWWAYDVHKHVRVSDHSSSQNGFLYYIDIPADEENPVPINEVGDDQFYLTIGQLLEAADLDLLDAEENLMDRGVSILVDILSYRKIMIIIIITLSIAIAISISL